MSEKIRLRLLAMTALALPVLSQAETGDELQRCAGIDDRDDRLTCYDTLSGRTAAQASVATTDTTRELDDEFGSELLEKSDEERRQDSTVTGNITSCKQDAYDKLLFRVRQRSNLEAARQRSFSTQRLQRNTHRDDRKRRFRLSHAHRWQVVVHPSKANTLDRLAIATVRFVG